MATLPNPSEILDFWFSERIRPFWFNSTPEFDQELREDFLNTYQAAVDGTLSTWEETPTGALALVIILDQFPRNMFRGQPQCFTGGTKSLRIAADAIAKKFDQTLADEQKSFFYLPYMHSENLADQDRSVELYEKAGLGQNLDFARHHREIVRRFGRFPHRNAILGRENTPEELAYLNSDQAFHG